MASATPSEPSHTRFGSSVSTAGICIGAAAAAATVTAIGALTYWAMRRQTINKQTRPPNIDTHADTYNNTFPHVDASLNASSFERAILSPPNPVADARLLKLSSSIPFLSSSLELRRLEGRGIGFVAIEHIQPGELLLVDSQPLSVETSETIPYDWSAYAKLVQMLYQQDSEAMRQLYVSPEAELEVESEYPIPFELRCSPIHDVTDAEWCTFLHAMANNAYMCQDIDPNITNNDESPSTIVDDGDDSFDLTSPNTSDRSSTSPDSCDIPSPNTPPPHRSRYTMNLHYLTCKFNHSCYPSACLSNGRVWSCSTIEPGEEICVSYLLPEQGLYLSTFERRKILRKTRHFVCKCCRCEGRSERMRQLEESLVGLESSEGNDPSNAAIISSLRTRIEEFENGDDDDDSCDMETSSSFRTLLHDLDQHYDLLPSTSPLRFTLRRRILLQPPSWLETSTLLRLFLEHYCMIQFILPCYHPYKIFEIDELFMSLERCRTKKMMMMIESMTFLLPKIDVAFQRRINDDDGKNHHQSIFFELCEDYYSTPFKDILDRWLPLKRRHTCHHAHMTPSSEDDGEEEEEEEDSLMNATLSTISTSTVPSSSSPSPSSLSSSSSSSPHTDAIVSTFICSDCHLPIDVCERCQPEQHFERIKIHQQICKIIQLTLT